MKRQPRRKKMKKNPSLLGKARRRYPLSPVAPPAPSHDLSPHPSHIQLPAASPNRLVVPCPCCFLCYLHVGITSVGCPPAPSSVCHHSAYTVMVAQRSYRVRHSSTRL